MTAVSIDDGDIVNDSTGSTRGSLVSQKSFGSISSAISYVKIKELGEGSYGKVTLYRNTLDDCLVVWKEMCIKSQTLSTIQSEIDILSLLDHPNVIGYYSHFVHENRVYIEMEYANNGTLHHYIADIKRNGTGGLNKSAGSGSDSTKNKYINQEKVEWFLYQMLCAVEYLHSLNIIHRDIKPHNIFLCTNLLLKIGDFGISKRLKSEEELAHTQIGTPLYTSPEVLNAHAYTSQSDIWGCGCVLYEMMSQGRHLVYGNHLLGIVMKITEMQFEPMPKPEDGIYSQELINILESMLLLEPSQRPTCKNILQNHIWSERQNEFKLRIDQLYGKPCRIHSETRPNSGQDVQKEVLAVNSKIFVWGGGKLSPVQIEYFTQSKVVPRTVSCAANHLAVVSVEGQVFTWATSSGSDLTGQLGHGKSVFKTPKPIVELKDVTIQSVHCGPENTYCVTNLGQLLGCGSNYYGQLGVDPSKIEMTDKFSSISISNPNTGEPESISKISCGSSHVLALTQDTKRVYSWGCGEYGRLGNGSEDDVSVPTLVQLPIQSEDLKLQEIVCGPDCSFLIVAGSHRVLACGNNEYGKLGLDVHTKLEGKRFLNKPSSVEHAEQDIPFQTRFKCVAGLRKILVAQICCGIAHVLIVDMYGKLYVCGDNRRGQLGLGDVRRYVGVKRGSKALWGKVVTQVSCGDWYSVVATNDNEVYSWGYSLDGRLGGNNNSIRPTNQLSGNSSSHRIWANPRPIFGVLWNCVNIQSNCSWQTIMLGEQVLLTNTMVTNSIETVSKEASLAGTNSNFSNNFENSSRIPMWLRDELEEAEVINVDEARYTDNKYAQSSVSLEIDNENNAGMYNCECGCSKCQDYIEQLLKQIHDLKQE